MRLKTTKKEKAKAAKGDQPVHLRFPLELHEQVKAYAIQENRSISNAIITLVKTSLTN